MPKSRAVDRALSGDYDQLRRAGELPSVKAAQQSQAQPRSLLQTGPGIGTILRLELLEELHDLPRLPRLQEVGSAGRLGTGAKASAGKRSGTAGPKSGHAAPPWACSAAAVLLLRAHPAGHNSLARWEQPPGQGQACPGVAPHLARAVSSLCTRDPASEREQCLQREGSGAGEPAASRGPSGLSLQPGRCPEASPAAAHAQEHIKPDRLSILVVGDRATIEPGLRSLDLPLVVLDTEGEVVEA